MADRRALFSVGRPRVRERRRGCPARAGAVHGRGACAPSPRSRRATSSQPPQPAARLRPPGPRGLRRRRGFGVLLRVHDLLLARQEQALDLIQLETGKARRHAFEEVADAANVLRYYAVRAPGWLAPSRRRGAIPLLTRTTREISPAGVVAVIVPWNYPLNLFITDITPALVERQRRGRDARPADVVHGALGARDLARGRRCRTRFCRS